MPKRNIVWIAVVAVLVVGLWKLPEIVARRDALYDQFSPLLDARVEILKRYVEEIDEDQLVVDAIDGMLDGLDPYCEYYTHSEHEQFKKITDGEFIGIGVEVERASTGEIRIVSPIEGSPAFQAGLRPEDLITAIDGHRTADLANLTEGVELMTGNPNTSVALEIYRPSTEEIYEKTITRSRITVPSIRGWARTGTEWDYLIDAESRIGYVRILNFESHTAEQLHAVLQPLFAHHRIRGLIIDVRNNPGGLLEVVVSIANRFLSEGLIVSTRGRNTPERPYVAQSNETYPPIPVAIMINRGSASASEILAGALRDHGRAVLVGDRTYGKGSVQELIPLGDGGGSKGAVKITTAYYYLPNGERIHGIGVKPDILVELTPEQIREVHEAQAAVYDRIYLEDASPATATASAPARSEILIDPQLEKAIEWMRSTLATRPVE
jgi:carboxyl-terminal processing protease